jgi:signal peptidase II
MTENQEVRPQPAAALWRLAIAVLLLVLFADQALKIWVKTNMSLNSEIPMIGNWFILHYTENPGMAFGLELGGTYGKLFLTVFRIIAVSLGFWILAEQIKKRPSKLLILSIALVLSGAIGNIIDSVFYGAFFHEVNHYSGKWLMGWVVDMLYFPLVEGYYPNWFPFWAGEYFIFFSPVFNIADAAITIGVLMILLFQKRFFPPRPESLPLSDAEDMLSTANDTPAFAHTEEIIPSQEEGESGPSPSDSFPENTDSSLNEEDLKA